MRSEMNIERRNKTPARLFFIGLCVLGTVTGAPSTAGFYNVEAVKLVERAS